MTLNNRYEFVLLFDVRDGNPNGDPDTDNMPRIDPETNQGLVTDVCLKRKIRNYVQLAKNDVAPYQIFVKEKAILNVLQDQARTAVADDDPDLKKKGREGDLVTSARQWMCDHYFDVRTFGAVMSTGKNCGQVRGPVQIAFARSIDRVVPTPFTITRMAVTTEAESEKQEGGNRTMGRKYGIPYGLYRCEGFVSAHLAQQTGFSEDDLSLLWTALANMFDHDHSAARGMMAARKLWVFKHDSALGACPAHTLFDRIQVENPNEEPARAFTDYTITTQFDDLPKGVTVESKL